MMKKWEFTLIEQTVRPVSLYSLFYLSYATNGSNSSLIIQISNNGSIKYSGSLDTSGCSVDENTLGFQSKGYRFDNLLLRSFGRDFNSGFSLPMT